MFRINLQITEESLLDELKKKYGEFNFPQTLTVHNLTPMNLVFSFVRAYFEPKSVREVEFPDFASLHRFAVDIHYIGKVNGFSEIADISDGVTLEDDVSQEQKKSKKKQKKDNDTSENLQGE